MTQKQGNGNKERKQKKRRNYRSSFPGPKSKHTSLELICSLTLDGTIDQSHLLARETFVSSTQNQETSLKLLPVTSALGCNHPSTILKGFAECMNAKRLGQTAIPLPLLYSTHITSQVMNIQDFSPPFRYHALIFQQLYLPSILLEQAIRLVLDNGDAGSEKSLLSLTTP